VKAKLSEILAPNEKLDIHCHGTRCFKTRIKQHYTVKPQQNQCIWDPKTKSWRPVMSAARAVQAYFSIPENERPLNRKQRKAQYHALSRAEKLKPGEPIELVTDNTLITTIKTPYVPAIRGQYGYLEGKNDTDGIESKRIFAADETEGTTIAGTTGTEPDSAA
jgi:hypothetical protein